MIQDPKKNPLNILEQFYSLTQALLVYWATEPNGKRIIIIATSEGIRLITSRVRIRRAKRNKYEKDRFG